MTTGIIESAKRTWRGEESLKVMILGWWLCVQIPSVFIGMVWFTLNMTYYVVLQEPYFFTLSTFVFSVLGIAFVVVYPFVFISGLWRYKKKSPSFLVWLIFVTFTLMHLWAGTIAAYGAMAGLSMIHKIFT